MTFLAGFSWTVFVLVAVVAVVALVYGTEGAVVVARVIGTVLGWVLGFLYGVIVQTD